MLITAIFKVLSKLTAPPMNPFACTKVMSSMPDSYLSFWSSFIPLQASFRGFLSSNDPSCLATA